VSGFHQRNACTPYSGEAKGRADGVAVAATISSAGIVTTAGEGNTAAVADAVGLAGTAVGVGVSLVPQPASHRMVARLSQSQMRLRRPTALSAGRRKWDLMVFPPGLNGGPATDRAPA
jgi:hypothetical protein